MSHADGSYQMPVGANIPYNVIVYDASGKWIAAAAEGVSGAPNSTIPVHDLILTKGSLVVGRVTTGFGIPVPNTMVQSYGPHRPATTAATIGAMTDLSGRYVLRVAPGPSRIYVGNGMKEASQDATVAPGEIVTVNLVGP